MIIGGDKEDDGYGEDYNDFDDGDDWVMIMMDVVMMNWWWAMRTMMVVVITIVMLITMVVVMVYSGKLHEDGGFHQRHQIVSVLGALPLSPAGIQVVCQFTWQ